MTRDGQVIAFWRTVLDHEEALVDVHLARPLDAATRSALEDEVERSSATESTEDQRRWRLFKQVSVMASSRCRDPHMILLCEPNEIACAPCVS